MRSPSSLTGQKANFLRQSSGKLSDTFRSLQFRKTVYASRLLPHLPRRSGLYQSGGNPQSDTVRRTMDAYTACDENEFIDYEDNDQSVINVPGLRPLVGPHSLTSLVQCLCACIPLVKWFKLGKWQACLNTRNPDGFGGEFGTEFATILQKVWNDSSEALPASDLFPISTQNLQKINPTIDSSIEAITFLNALHEEFQQVMHKPHINYPTALPDPELAAFSWNAFRMRESSFITELFYGIHKQSLFCKQCQSISSTFPVESVINLPLPPATADVRKVEFIPFNGVTKTKEIMVQASVKETFEGLSRAIHDELQLSIDSTLVWVDVFRDKIFKQFNPYDSLAALPKEDRLVCYEVPKKRSMTLEVNFTKTTGRQINEAFCTPLIIDLGSKPWTIDSLKHHLEELSGTNATMARLYALNKDTRSCIMCQSAQLCNLTDLWILTKGCILGLLWDKEPQRKEFTAEKISITLQDSSEIHLNDCFTELCKPQPARSCYSCVRTMERKLDVWKFPEIAILKIERTSVVRYMRQQDNRIVQVPIIFDASRVAMAHTEKDKYYALFAMSELKPVGCVSYVWNSTNRQWYKISVSGTTVVSEEYITQRAVPALLFYQRINPVPSLIRLCVDYITENKINYSELLDDFQALIKNPPQ